MVTNFESTKQYSKPQLIQVGDAVQITLGRYRYRYRDRRRGWYY